MNLKDKALALAPELVKIRNSFHMHPELSFRETWTGDRIAEILQEHGIEVKRNVGKTGIVGILKGGKAGKVVALRGDIDGLPVEELNDVPYKSKISGVMHACGHDVHTTSLLGAAILLSSVRDDIPGTVKFIFQPAEEINEGARAMLADDVLKDPDVDGIFGLHNSPNIDAGFVGVKEGPLMAAVDTIKITIRGESGHGAVPDKAKDAVIAAASVILNLQTIVSRKVSPFDNVVVSIGTINGGRANNVISDLVEMKGTARTYEQDVRRKLPGIMENIITSTCAALETSGELDYEFTLPAVYNESLITAVGRRAVEKIVGPEGIVTPKLTGGGEDFALYQKEVPGCFYFLGVRNESRGIIHEWHHPNFDADEKAFPVGAGILAQSALDFLTGD